MDDTAVGWCRPIEQPPEKTCSMSQYKMVGSSTLLEQERRLSAMINDERPLKGLAWGLCHSGMGGWNYIQRYEIDEQLKDWFNTKTTYE